MRTKHNACWHCPIACWGTSKVEYKGETMEAHQPEYETAAAFGSMTLNSSYPSLVKANELCNRYGAGHHLGRRLHRLRHRVLRARPDRHEGHRRR